MEFQDGGEAVSGADRARGVWGFRRPRGVDAATGWRMGGGGVRLADSGGEAAASVVFPSVEAGGRGEPPGGEGAGAGFAESGGNPVKGGDGPGGVRGAGQGAGGVFAPVDGGDAVYGEAHLRDARRLAGRAVCLGGEVSDGRDEQGRVYVAAG